MLTEAANGANSPPRAVMMSVAEIARRDGVSKPTVSVHIKRLVDRHGLTVERDGQGRVARVNVAEYDHLRGVVGDPSKAQAQRPPAPTPQPASESYDEALRQKTWHQAEQLRLQMEAFKGRLVEVEQIEVAIGAITEEIARVIDRLPNLADDIAAAVAREGAHGGRVLLRGHAAKLRQEIATALSALAKAPAPSEPDSQTAS
jgi:DNA-binding transcriptional ArsR family regulator